MKYVVYDNATLTVMKWGQCSDEAGDLAAQAGAGQTAIEVERLPDPGPVHRVVDGAVVTP